MHGEEGGQKYFWKSELYATFAMILGFRSSGPPGL